MRKAASRAVTIRPVSLDISAIYAKRFAPAYRPVTAGAKEFGTNSGTKSEASWDLAEQTVYATGMTVTAEFGADDALVQVRVVPAGRDGSKVAGAHLAPRRN